MACFCNEIAKATGTTCTLIYPNANMTKVFLESLDGTLNASSFLPSDIPVSCWKGWNYFQFILLSVQHLCAFSFVLHIGKSKCFCLHVFDEFPSFHFKTDIELKFVEIYFLAGASSRLLANFTLLFCFSFF